MGLYFIWKTTRKPAWFSGSLSGITNKKIYFKPEIRKLLKGKNSLMIFQKFVNRKFAYRNRKICIVWTQQEKMQKIEEYIKNQLKQDRESD